MSRPKFHTQFYNVKDPTSPFKGMPYFRGSTGEYYVRLLPQPMGSSVDWFALAAYDYTDNQYRFFTDQDYEMVKALRDWLFKNHAELLKAAKNPEGIISPLRRRFVALGLVVEHEISRSEERR